MKRKINLNFIPINTVPKGVKSLGVYDENNRKVGDISLGNLVPKSKGDKLYTFGALSDVHLPYDTGLQDFTRALNYFNNVENVDFICISGDMGSSGVDSEWANFKTQVDAHSPNTPVHISAGNHDAGQSAPKTYEYPIPYTGNPLYYSFTQGNDVFIMFGMTFWGDPPFSRESLQWLYETLEENRNKRCFVFQHMMRKGHAGDASGRYSWDGLNNTNGKVFLSLMEHYKNVLWFHGHSHCEFEQQDTLSLPNSNYDRLFGCHSIHVPSCCVTRNEDNSYEYEDSEGYVVDVYENGIHLRGRDFVAEKFLPISSYWIDNTLVEISEKSYVDSRGVIDTGSNPPSDNIVIFDKSEFRLNERYSLSGGAVWEVGGIISINPSVEPNTTYKLTYRGAKTDIRANYDTLYLVSSDGVVSTINGNSNISKMTQGVVYNTDYTGVDVTFTTQADTIKIWFSIPFNSAGTYIMNVDEVTDVVLTLQVVDNEDTVPEEPETFIIDVMKESEKYLNQRWSKSNNTLVTQNGRVALIFPINVNTTTVCAVTIENSPINLQTYKDYISIFFINEGKTGTFDPEGGSAPGYYDSVVWYNNNRACTFLITIVPNCKYIALTVPLNASATEATESDLSGLMITLQVGDKPSNITNLIPLSIDENGNDFVGTNGEDGYIKGYRVKSDGSLVAAEGVCSTGFMPVTCYDKIRIANYTAISDASQYARITYYDASKTVMSPSYVSLFDANNIIDEGNNVIMTQPYLVVTQDVAFFRLSTHVIDENTIITVNEPIK